MSERNIFEKIILAGVGALSLTGEKSMELLDELVKRGEITVEQGKVLNEELRHTAKTVMAGESVRGDTSLLQQVEQLTPQELAALKEKLAQLESAQPEE